VIPDLLLFLAAFVVAPALAVFALLALLCVVTVLRAHLGAWFVRLAVLAVAGLAAVATYAASGPCWWETPRPPAAVCDAPPTTTTTRPCQDPWHDGLPGDSCTWRQPA